MAKIGGIQGKLGAPTVIPESQITAIGMGLRGMRTSPFIEVSNFKDIYNATLKHYNDIKIAHLVGTTTDVKQRYVEITTFYFLLIQMVNEVLSNTGPKQKKLMNVIYKWFNRNKGNIMYKPLFGKDRLQKEAARFKWEMPPKQIMKLAGNRKPKDAKEPDKLSSQNIINAPPPSLLSSLNSPHDNEAFRTKKTVILDSPKVENRFSKGKPIIDFSSPYGELVKKKKDGHLTDRKQRLHSLSQWNSYLAKNKDFQNDLSKLQYCGRSGHPAIVRYCAHDKSLNHEGFTKDILSTFCDVEYSNKPAASPSPEDSIMKTELTDFFRITNRFANVPPEPTMDQVKIAELANDNETECISKYLGEIRDLEHKKYAENEIQRKICKRECRDQMNRSQQPLINIVRNHFLSSSSSSSSSQSSSENEQDAAEKSRRRRMTRNKSPPIQDHLLDQARRARKQLLAEKALTPKDAADADKMDVTSIADSLIEELREDDLIHKSSKRDNRKASYKSSRKSSRGQTKSHGKEHPDYPAKHQRGTNKNANCNSAQYPQPARRSVQTRQENANDNCNAMTKRQMTADSSNITSAADSAASAVFYSTPESGGSSRSDVISPAPRYLNSGMSLTNFYEAEGSVERKDSDAVVTEARRKGKPGKKGKQDSKSAGKYDHGKHSSHRGYRVTLADFNLGRKGLDDNAVLVPENVTGDDILRVALRSTRPGYKSNQSRPRNAASCSSDASISSDDLDDEGHVKETTEARGNRKPRQQLRVHKRNKLRLIKHKSSSGYTGTSTDSSTVDDYDDILQPMENSSTTEAAGVDVGVKGAGGVAENSGFNLIPKSTLTRPQPPSRPPKEPRHSADLNSDTIIRQMEQPGRHKLKQAYRKARMAYVKNEMKGKPLVDHRLVGATRDRLEFYDNPKYDEKFTKAFPVDTLVELIDYVKDEMVQYKEKIADEPQRGFRQPALKLTNQNRPFTAPPFLPVLKSNEQLVLPYGDDWRPISLSDRKHKPRAVQPECTPANSLTDENKSLDESSHSDEHKRPQNAGSSTSGYSPRSTVYSLTSCTDVPVATPPSSRADEATPPSTINGDSSISSDSYEVTRPTTCPITLSETASTYKLTGDSDLLENDNRPLTSSMSIQRLGGKTQKKHRYYRYNASYFKDYLSYQSSNEYIPSMQFLSFSAMMPLLGKHSSANGESCKDADSFKRKNSVTFADQLSINTFDRNFESELKELKQYAEITSERINSEDCKNLESHHYDVQDEGNKTLINKAEHLSDREDFSANILDDKDIQEKCIQDEEQVISEDKNMSQANKSLHNPSEIDDYTSANALGEMQEGEENDRRGPSGTSRSSSFSLDISKQSEFDHSTARDNCGTERNPANEDEGDDKSTALTLPGNNSNLVCSEEQNHLDRHQEEEHSQQHVDTAVPSTSLHGPSCDGRMSKTPLDIRSRGVEGALASALDCMDVKQCDGAFPAQERLSCTESNELRPTSILRNHSSRNRTANPRLDNRFDSHFDSNYNSTGSSFAGGHLSIKCETDNTRRAMSACSARSRFCLRNGMSTSRAASNRATTPGGGVGVQIGFQGNRQTTWSSRKGVYQPVDQVLEIYPAKQKSTTDLKSDTLSEHVLSRAADVETTPSTPISTSAQSPSVTTSMKVVQLQTNRQPNLLIRERSKSFETFKPKKSLRPKLEARLQILEHADTKDSENNSATYRKYSAYQRHMGRMHVLYNQPATSPATLTPCMTSVDLKDIKQQLSIDIPQRDTIAQSPQFSVKGSTLVTKRSYTDDSRALKFTYLNTVASLIQSQYRTYRIRRAYLWLRKQATMITVSWEAFVDNYRVTLTAIKRRFSLSNQREYCNLKTACIYSRQLQCYINVYDRLSENETDHLPIYKLQEFFSQLQIDIRNIATDDIKLHIYTDEETGENYLLRDEVISCMFYLRPLMFDIGLYRSGDQVKVVRPRPLIMPQNTPEPHLISR